MSPDNLHSADNNMVILLRFFLPSLIGVFIMIGVFVGYKWKVSRDKAEIENLKADNLRLKMEALAAEKKAQRKDRKNPGKEERKSGTGNWNNSDKEQSME
jgi:hypothetical protein